MSYLVLARKYRPQSFEQVVGQEHITRTLQNSITGNRVSHALLFAGPRGVGKTSVARIMAKAMNCIQGPTPCPCNTCQSCKEITQGSALDVIEIDGASNRGINEIRELRENIKYMPSRSRFKVYIIDEVHMLTNEAFNALLKTLEEPPAHVLFFFATTEPHKIPITILSRCQRHNFRRIPLSDIVRTLRRVSEDLSFSISDESLRLIAREASGGLRDSLSLLDQVMVYSGNDAGTEEVLDSLGVIDRRVLFDLSKAIFGGDIAAALDLIEKIHLQGYDLKRLYSEMLEHFRDLVVLKINQNSHLVANASENEITLMKQHTETLSPEAVIQVFTTWFDAETSIRFSTQPRSALEILCIQLAQFRRVTSIDQILQKIDQIVRGLDGVPQTPERNSPPADDSMHATKVSTKAVPAKATSTHAATLGQTWEQLLGVFNERCKSLIPSLEKAVLKKVGKDFLEITVEGNSFFAARLRDQKSIEMMEEICRQFFDRKMQIRIEEKRQGTPKTKRTGENESIKHLKKEALNHPVVTDALEVFQGRVVDVKIL
jgi:DNA polymerase-3 subunit gamma/tau